MAEEWRSTAYRLLEAARELRGDLRAALLYFLEEVSVGDLRAAQDLMKRGVKDPATAVERLIGMGLVERGRDCLNLADPLRRMLAERGLEALERAI